MIVIRSEHLENELIAVNTNNRKPFLKWKLYKSNEFNTADADSFSSVTMAGLELDDRWSFCLLPKSFDETIVYIIIQPAILLSLEEDNELTNEIKGILLFT